MHRASPVGWSVRSAAVGEPFSIAWQDLAPCPLIICPVGLRRGAQGRTAGGDCWHAETMVSSVAVQADIHGVMPALDAVLAEPLVSRYDEDLS
jgi:hypothetical protein